MEHNWKEKRTGMEEKWNQKRKSMEQQFKESLREQACQEFKQIKQELATENQVIEDIQDQTREQNKQNGQVQAIVVPWWDFNTL